MASMTGGRSENGRFCLAFRASGLKCARYRCLKGILVPVEVLGWRAIRLVAGLCAAGLVAACGHPNDARVAADAPAVAGYGAIQDEEYTLPAVPAQYLVPPNRKAEVAYNGPEAPGTLVVDPFAKFLYLVEEGGEATRYPIAAGREGRGFKGNAVIGMTKKWPGWQPTRNMLRSEPEVYGAFAKGVPGGLASPLGARALYLYRGGKDSHYRIHGTNDLEAIGNAGTAGCVRLFNQDIIDLFGRVETGAKVHVRSLDESIALEGPDAQRGAELPPRIIPPDEIYGAVNATSYPVDPAAAPTSADTVAARSPTDPFAKIN